MSFQRDAEPHSSGTGSKLRDFILGSQDGLVNILGLVLGIATATNDLRIILIGGLAATFAESIAMAAVAYTSSKAMRDFYNRELAREKREMEEMPDAEREEIREIYRNKGFKGDNLEMVVDTITSDKQVWLESMMAEELHLFPEGYEKPVINGLTVGTASLLGSIVPLIPFVLFPIQLAVVASIIGSLLVLFIIGAIKARLTVGNWIKSGIEMGVIGLVAAGAGYIIGLLLSNL